MAVDEPRTQTRLTDRVAEEIRALLARRRISGRQLARQLGESPSWVNFRLTGHTAIGLDDLDRIARALDVEITDLLPATVRLNRRSAAVPVRTTPIRPRRDVSRPKGRSAAESTRPQSAGRATSRRARVIGSPNRPMAVHTPIR